MRNRKYNYNLIFEEYKNGTSCKELGKKYLTDPRTIRKILKTLGVVFRNPRRYIFNESYFENINSKDKAYFLGLIMSDGCNT